MSRTGIERAQSRVGKTDANDLDMGVFLHASEIEHEANVGHLLLAEPGAKVATRPDEQCEPVRMWLQCVKGRDFVKTITPLLFEGHIQRFTLREIGDTAAKRRPTEQTKSETKPRRRSGGGKTGGGNVLKDGETRWL